MNALKLFFIEDLSPYLYFMTDKQVKNFKRNKILCALVSLLLLYPLRNLLVLFPLVMLAFYKLPYFILKLRHNQNCNDVVSAVPLWLNTVYALIEQNTIHNAIVNSLDNDTPLAIKSDLKKFVDTIEACPDDKKAYTGFLQRYKIDGFEDIMLKLYEFRALSKERLKQELRSMNKDIDRLEELKAENQRKMEVDIYDYMIGSMLFIFCIYAMIMSLNPSMIQM